MRPGIHLNLNLNLFGKHQYGRHGSLRLDKIHVRNTFGPIAVFRCLPTSLRARFAALAWTVTFLAP